MGAHSVRLGRENSRFSFSRTAYAKLLCRRQFNAYMQLASTVLVCLRGVLPRQENALCQNDGTPNRYATRIRGWGVGSAGTVWDFPARPRRRRCRRCRWSLADEREAAGRSERRSILREWPDTRHDAEAFVAGEGIRSFAQNLHRFRPDFSFAQHLHKPQVYTEFAQEFLPIVARKHNKTLANKESNQYTCGQ